MKVREVLATFDQYDLELIELTQEYQDVIAECMADYESFKADVDSNVEIAKKVSKSSYIREIVKSFAVLATLLKKRKWRA